MFANKRTTWHLNRLIKNQCLLMAYCFIIPATLSVKIYTHMVELTEKAL